jgi:O-acetyl-ADP-ribose deacetylase (regulator of RNase III)
MTLELVRGDLLKAEVDAIVNATNTVGVMGKGLALQIKKVFPDVFAAYVTACKDKTIAIGRVHVVERASTPRFVINFPTKTDYRKPSKLEYIDAGLPDLIDQVRERAIRSIAIPALGCGLGGLAWNDVKPRIVSAFAALPEVQVLLYEPA